MRITTQTIQRNILSNLNRITNGLSQVYDQLATGKQINTLSDNPMGAITALGLRSNVAELNQYQSNLVFGNNWITNSESSLRETKDLLMRGKVLALQSINGVLTPENREITAKEVKNLYDQAVLLANTQMNGKYIFGGYRTSGYTVVEPAPFIPDTVDGYRINGTNIPTMDEALTTDPVLDTADLQAGDLLINGEDMGAVDLISAGLTDGLNMGGAFNLKGDSVAGTGINGNSTSVIASLTTLYADIAATAVLADTTVDFSLNNIPIHVDIPVVGSTATETADLTVAAINAETDRTGVRAEKGNVTSTNGGPADSIVFRNALEGDESAIVVSDMNVTEEATLGFGNFNQGADALHNTGQISLSSTESFSIFTSASDDTILDLVGLGGGNRFFNDEADDGTLTYGYRLNSGDLVINGLEIGAADDDGVSTVYADSSAMAKAAAINAVLDQTGVTAEVTPVYLQATGGPVVVDLDNPPLTGTVNNTTISAGELAVNGYPTTVDIVSELPVNGLAMGMAASAKTAIMQADPDVEVRLTTLMAGDQITAGNGLNAGESVSFTVNGVAINYTALLGLTETQTAQEIVDAANAAFTGAGLTIEALVGDGANGGAMDSIVFRNTNTGDESQIVIADIDPADPAEAKIGLANGTYISDETHNTGQISIDAQDKFTLTSPGVSDDSILNNLGLGGGGIGFGDVANDGELIYGRRMSAIGTGDLIINGVDIFSASTGIDFLDSDNALINAINAEKDNTGIAASRSSSGRIILSAQDGRNLHIQTSANGERITRLNGGSPATPQSKVYFGSVGLVSDRTFMVEDPSRSLAGDPSEWALTGLGLAGGAAITGEPTDQAGDGEISVKSIVEQENSIRYAGDRLNDINIKVGKTSTLAIGRNGQDTLMNTQVFSSLKELELHLTGEHYTAVTGVEKATDLSVPLAKGGTGLTREDEFTNGYFSITVTDHAYAPTRDFAISIGVDPEKDTLNSVATKIDGVPGVNASWDDNGQLSIEVSDPERFTIKLQDGTSQFLELVGITSDIMQNQALDQDLASLDGAMNALTNQISDFGAKANRIDVQNKIFEDLDLNSTQQLSETEDTDLAEALLQLQTKQAAYQTALTAASRVMQMSLVDFLR